MLLQLQMDRETAMYHSKSDENVGQQHSITYSKGHVRPINGLDMIKLRDVNTRDGNSYFHPFDGKESLDFVDYLREPEKVVPSTKRRSHHFQPRKIDIESLENINTQFIPDSPSLAHTLASVSFNSPDLLRESTPVPLPLPNLPKYWDREYDCCPFFHIHDYESRLEPEDFGSILAQMVEDQIANRRPVFQRELEYQELRKFVRKIDYFIFYVLGTDRSGFFKLQRARKAFYESSVTAYTSPLAHFDCCENQTTFPGRSDD